MKKGRFRFVILGLLFVVAILLVVTTDASGQSPLPTPVSPLPTPPGNGGENGGFDWMELLEWILENKDQIVEVVLLVVALILSWINRGQAAEKYGVELMREAEELARKHVIESGPERMEHVVSTLVDKLPKDVKVVLKVIARLRGMTFEELVAGVAQGWFDKVAGSG